MYASIDLILYDLYDEERESFTQVMVIPLIYHPIDHPIDLSDHGTWIHLNAYEIWMSDPLDE